jgi:hypothetical protein
VESFATRITGIPVELDNGTLAEVPVTRSAFTEITGLPKGQPGVLYLVSALVAQAAAKQGRRDVISPDTSPAGAIRDENGQIVGVKGFQTFGDRVLQ